MIIVIPLGGIGKRFSDLGYKDPKPLIKVLGKEIIFWVLDNLKINKEDKIYIVYNKVLDDYNFINFFGKYPSVNFLKLEFNTKGPVETIFQLTKILDKSNENEGLLILDGDTFYKNNIIKKINLKYDNIFYHKTLIKEPIFSYVGIKNKKITKIAEKIKISNNANTGAYYFNNLKKFNDTANQILKINKRAYVSDIYKYLLKKKNIIIPNLIKNNEFACLGTPKQVMDFCKSNKSLQQRFCFDLDNTLVSYPSIPGNYKTVKPIEKNIKFLNFLKSCGHHIIIYTARRMRTHKGDVFKVKKEIEKLTKSQLKKFKIKYDELILGKPYAHHYIDDLSINPADNLNFKLGYYETKDFLSRPFNDVIVGEKFTIKYSKNLNKLQAEINYLKKIPKKLKSFFPKLISHKKDWYKMETVNGSKLSYLLINNLLTKQDLKKLFIKISTIHHLKKLKKNNTNIYQNYSKKLKLRTNKRFINLIGGKNFNNLKKFLQEYEKKDYGTAGIIHGDPVFTNIIKKDNGDFIFLDPRGSQLNQMTIYGDINYDYAKIYQSLTGYENIISDKFIDEVYLKNLRQFYEGILIENTNYENILKIRKLASSLYFTLIDFHDEKYKFKFIDKGLSLLSTSDI